MERVTDWAKFHEETWARIEGSNKSNAELLEEFRGLLRSCRQSLPTYRQVQEPMRYAATVEDLDILQDTYTQLKGDTAGIFEREDHVDAVVRAQESFQIIHEVLIHGPGPGAKADMKQKSAGTSIGCAVALLALPLLAVTAWIAL